jgi:hypothetical protein
VQDAVGKFWLGPILNCNANRAANADNFPHALLRRRRCGIAICESQNART